MLITVSKEREAGGGFPISVGPYIILVTSMRRGRTQIHIHNNGWTDGHNFGAKNQDQKEVSHLEISTQYNVKKSEREIASPLPAGDVYLSPLTFPSFLVLIM